ncbi:MAG: hypothetical protein AAFV95_07875 [Bacteroidota bacterium]
MFNFEANIVKRRRISKSRLFYGLLSVVALVYMGISYLQYGSVSVLERLVNQIGLYDYMDWIYLGVFATLLILIFPAVHTLFRKKTVVGGKVSFDEENLQIVKGRDKYLIPEEQLQQMEFQLKALPSGNRKKEDQLFGGSFMKIPTKKGTFECELDIDSPRQKEKLLEMIEFLKIEHDVKVKIKETK